MTRSETAFAFIGGMKENLRLQSELIIERFFKGLGPNAKGEFRFRITFIPDRNDE